MGLKHRIFSYFFTVVLMLTPLVSFGIGEEILKGTTTTTINTFLDLDTLRNTFKQNISLPALFSPKEAIKSASPKLQEINRGLEEETGVNLEKFSKWILKILKTFFQFLAHVLERISNG